MFRIQSFARRPIGGTHAAVAIIVGTCLALLLPSVARAQTSFTLTINMVGPSPGTVGVIPNGSLCSLPTTQCTFQVTSGTVVRMAANTLPGSVPGRFSAGTGSGTGCALSSCSFTMTADTAVTATFNAADNVPTATVTVSLLGDGQGNVSFDNGRCQNFDSATFSNCQSVYLQGSVVTHDAAPAAGSRFSGFSAGTGGAGACGTTQPCVYTLTGNATLTGTFHALTAIAVSPSTATRGIGQTQSFIANGTYSNNVTEQIPFGSMGTWRTKTAMPAKKFGLGMTVANGRLYAIGGNDSGAPGAPGPIVRVYDPVADTWTTAASMLTGREGLGVVTVNGLIYAIGGNKQGGIATDVVERYDPSTNTWTSRAPLPAARRYLAAGVVNGIIYAVGGETVSGGVSTTVKTVEAYDPATNVWTTKAPMLAARMFHAVGVVNGILYAVGGPLGAVEAYDPATDTWTAKASQPNGGNGGALAVAVVDDVLYAVGGAGSGTTMLQYDAVRDAWNNKSGLPTSRSELGAVGFNGVIYAVGGLPVPNPGPNTTTSLNTVQAFTDHLHWISSAPAVARATQQGQANAIAAGTADMIASVGAMTCGASCGRLTVTSAPPTMAIDKSSLTFAATSNGSAFVQQTGSQAVRLTQAGAGTVTWTATPTQPWITVSPTSGTGTATLTIAVTHVSSLPASGGVSGLINFAFTGASNSSTAMSVALNIVASGASGVPAGAFETPVNNTSGVSGSIAVTGWAIDDVEVTRVRIVRDPASGETPGQQVFIGNAVFVDGARPDVAQQFPSAPRNTRAGWGYLLLTNFLPNQGNGTFRLHAYADDADGHTTLLGSSTIVCDNAAATRPFGAIDTPQQGDTVSGSINNFGWVLSRGTTRADPPSGGTVVALVDGVAVGAPGAWGSRADLAALFPVAQYAGVVNALGVLGIDTTTLANGVHTIAWIVTDNLGGADGVGSRYFTTSNGSALVAEPSVGWRDPAALAMSAALDTDAMVGRRGYHLDAPLTPLTADGSGRFTMVGEELDRFELHLGDAVASGPVAYAGYLRTGAELWRLPIGSHLDQATGVFTWQPGVAFVGPYDFVFVRSEAGVAMRRDVRLVLQPKGSGRGRPQVAIDMPGQGEVAQPFVIAGWAADLDARAGTGISTLHVWAYPVTPATVRRCDGATVRQCDSATNPFFIGATAYGGRRPDVAGIYGPQYRDSGYGLSVDGLAPGTYDLAVFAWSTVTQGFVPAKVVRVIVRAGR